MTFGTLSTTSTNFPEISLDLASQIPFTQPCHPQKLVIKEPEFTANQTTFHLEENNLSNQRFSLLFKCLLIIKNLSDDAVEEALEDCDRIIDFYTEKQQNLEQNSVVSLPTYKSFIKIKVLPPKIRPSLVLDDF